MKKKVYLILLALGLLHNSYTQKIELSSNKKTFSIVENTPNKITLRSYVNDLSFSTVKGNSSLFSSLAVQGYVTNHKIGAPDLPTLNKLLDIPYGASIEINILGQTEEIIDLSSHSIRSIYPSQPSISKGEDASSVPFYFDEATYSSDIFISDEIAKVVPLGKMRGHQLGRLEISPFQYNPVTNILKVISEVEFEINFVGADHALTDVIHSKYNSSHFNASFDQLINSAKAQNKDMLTSYPVKYVIVSDPSFQTALQPFVEWKTKKGFTVIEAYTNDPAVGNTTASIKAFLENLYNSGTANDPSPSYLLLVGDVAQVPSFSGITGSHVSDLYYCEYDGAGDFYPELYYGRFPATNISEVQNMVNKTIQYEQYLFPDPSFLGRAVMISGVDASMAPTYGNGQINYGTDYYINPAHSINSQTYLYPASGSSGAQIIQDVNNGAGFVNYTAHGYGQGWADPSFTCTDVYNMTNEHQLPLMIGNCCQSNMFDDPECFGEALLRVENRGAIGYIGGSNNTYWDEDYWWAVGAGSITVNPTYNPLTLAAYDRTFHENGEAAADWHITNAQLMLAGNLAVTQGGGDEDYYYEIYHLMGDPSLMTYFGVPSHMSVSHMAAVPIGTSSLSVASEPDAYVAISMNGILLDAQLTDASGVVNLNFSPLSAVGSADVVVTKQNKQPYLGTVQVISSNSPFVAYDNHINLDATGNNDGLADYGELINLDVTLGNFGMLDANGVTAQLTSSNTNVTIVDDSDNWGTILSNDLEMVSNAFSVVIANDVIDQEVINYEIVVSDNGSNSWTSYFSMLAHAPLLEIEDVSIDDVAGNGNGRIEAGETVNFLIPSNNIGSSSCTSLTGTLTTSSSYVSITNSSYSFGALPSVADSLGTFEIIIDPNTPFGEVLEFTYLLEDGAYSEIRTFTEIAGIFSEDFETGDYNLYNWNVVSSNPWTIDPNEVYEGSYSSVSADIGNDELSTMEIDIDVISDGEISFMKKVSSESSYDFLKFYVDGQLQGEWSGEVNWSSETFFVNAGQHTFSWVYSKDESVSDGSDAAWVDYILFPPMNSTLGLESLDVFSDFIVYPNPTSNSFEVYLKALQSASVRIVVFDTKGKLVKQYSEQLNNGINLFNFNLDGEADGMYLVNFTDGVNSISRQVILRR